MKRFMSLVVCLAVLLCMSMGVLAAEKTKLIWTARHFEDERGLMWVSWAEEFEKTHPDVDIVPTMVADYYNTITTWVAGGQAPDIAWMGQQFWDYTDHLLDLMPLYKSNKDLSEITAQMISAHSFNGKLFAMPYGAVVHAAFYNKNMLNAAGVTIPKGWTWQDAINIGTRLTVDSDGNGTPERWGLGFYEDTKCWRYGDTVPYSKDGKTITIDNPVTVEGFETWIDLSRNRTNINKPTSTYDGKELYNGVAAIVNRGVFELPTYRAQADFEWDVAEIPWLAASNGKKYYSTFYSSETWTIFKSSKNQELAKEFLAYIVSKEKMSQLAQLGGIIPTQPSVAVKSFLTASEPKNIRVFTDTLAYYNGGTPYHPAGTILRPIWTGTLWGQMMGNTLPAKTAISEMAKLLQAELDKWWANH